MGFNPGSPNPLSYQGVLPSNPPNQINNNRPPTVNDISQNIGDEWRNNAVFPAQFYKLANLNAGQATWITLATGIQAQDIVVDASTSPGTNPVVPTAGGFITITGGQVAAGTVGAQVIRTDSLAANTFTIEIQRSAAVASSASTNNGVSHFNSSQFSVDGNGFVSLSGLAGITTLSDDVGTTINPTSGNIQLVGHVNEQGGKFSTIVAGTHLANINPMSPARWIVDPLGFNGTHTTITAALASATSGDTIFILPGTYTEDLTLVAGVNLTAFGSDGVASGQGNPITPNVIIKGTTTVSYTGSVTISGIQLLTSGAAALATTGSNAGNIILQSCSIYAFDSTGMTFNNHLMNVNFFGCVFNSASTNSLFSATTVAGIDFENCVYRLSSTGSASTIAVGRAVFNACDMSGVNVTTSSTGSIFALGCSWGYGGNTLLTTAGTGTSEIYNSNLESTTASTISVGVGTTVIMANCSVNSSNTNAITGAGTLNYNGLVFTGVSSTINTSTQNPIPWPVQQGGTAASSFTAYAPVCGGTTTTGALQSASTGISTSGFVLTSTGSSSLPTFQAVSGSGAVTTIDGDTGSATPSSGIITFDAISQAGCSVSFSGSSHTISLNVTDSNDNTCVGLQSGNVTVTASGASNSLFGYQTGKSLTTGVENTIIGTAAGTALTTGQENIIIGATAGTNYTTSESSNIIIGAIAGTAAESQVTRIGKFTQTACYIGGIQGISVSNLNIVTINTSTGQLGSQAAANVGTVTQYNALIGGAAGAIASVAPSATSGVPLISQGAASNPVFGTVVVAGGGTGAVTLTGVLTGNGTSAVTANAVTQHGVVVGGASNAVGSTAVGATGTVLIGNTGADPTYSATPTVTSITFGAGTALSVYAVGTFTPTLDGSVSGTTTYSNQQGYYTKIGNMVFIQGFISLSGATGTGSVTLGGFPFTVKNQTNGYPTGAIFWEGGASWTWPVGATNISTYGILNTTTALVWVSGTAIAGGNMQMANAALTVSYSLAYQV
jgi:hypothetical protein